MRKVFAIAVLGLLTLTVPVLAAVPVTNDGPNATPPGGGGRSSLIECPGTVVWDTGMYDEFTPPVTCSSAYSTGCFINAINDGGNPVDWRQGAGQFLGTAGDPLTHIKFWGRYNQQGYDYHIATPGSLHGFCIRIYDDPAQGTFCPDGTRPDALGLPVYDQYVGAGGFVEEEITTGVPRNYDYCVTLPQPFYMVADHYYWINISADFDMTAIDGVWTQWFHRMAPPGSALLCEPVVNYNTTGPSNWIQIWSALALPCWQGWDVSLKLYTGQVVEPTGACCINTSCQVLTPTACAQAGGRYVGDDVPCVPNPCATPAKSSSWGQIKGGYR